VCAAIRKINFGTALNISFTNAVRARLDTDATVIDPRTYLADARSAMSLTVTDLLTVIGC
jgi:fructose-bisphosphate aldolase class II